METSKFPPFNLSRLLRTVFEPKAGEKVCILIDLKDPTKVKNFEFLKDPTNQVQRHAVEVFFEGLKKTTLAELKLTGGELFAYEVTGGSNLDLPTMAYDVAGNRVDMIRDIYKKFDIVLCISTYSATAPLTAFAKEYGFRGATMHGVNPIILGSGLAVDYNDVSKEAEKLRQGLTKADWVEIDYECLDKKYTLHIELGEQEAQKSHGLCKEKGLIANLPAGEVYFVPTGAKGEFPMTYEDKTLGLMHVEGGRILTAKLLRGNQITIDEHNLKLKSDPMTGAIGELGFGTQVLPIAGSDIQDEKILGTFHVATGRSDHLGGDLTPEKFVSRKNAAHDDILFAPHKTPDVKAPQVRMKKNNRVVTVLENYKPAKYLAELLCTV